MKLLIVADDLSGAADCAIPFATAGLRTVVTLDASHPTGEAQVVAVDTDTRRLSGADAAARSVAAWRLLAHREQRLYKKIDSTLRGNWAAEVAGLQRVAGLAIVAPAFPATGRTTVEGRVLVNGQSLESTDTWQLEHAGQCADLEVMLQQAGLRTARLPLATLRGNREALAEFIVAAANGQAQALIVDAQTAADLGTLATVTSALDQAFFWVGSGGLAREIAALPRRSTPAAPANIFTPNRQAPVLVLVGSLSAVSERQCAMLKQRAEIVELVVAPSVLREGRSHADWQACTARIGAHLQQGEDLLLRIGRDAAFDPAEGALLSTALGELVREHFAQLGGLVVTGGETARAMLAATGIGSLDLLCEIEAGVALGLPVASRNGHRPGVVTKAGAFGTDHALYASWLHLKDATEPAAHLAALV